MGFKLKKTSDNLFHKVSESKLDGGKVTQQPKVNMEAPSSPAKAIGPIGLGLLVKGAKALFGGSGKKGAESSMDSGGTGVAGENGLGKKTAAGDKAVNSTRALSSDISMTPYSVKDGKGTIHGPKVSYDMAYDKAKKTKQYANMSKSDYIKEAKRQTKSFNETGKWDASGSSKPKRKKVEAVKAPKAAGVSAASTPKAKVDLKAKPVETKTTKRSSRLNKTNDKIASAKASGKDKKAARLEKRANKIKGRTERKAVRKSDASRGDKRKAIIDSREKQKKANSNVPDYSGQK
jgi:hypothetical protein